MVGSPRCGWAWNLCSSHAWLLFWFGSGRESTNCLGLQHCWSAASLAWELLSHFSMVSGGLGVSWCCWSVSGSARQKADRHLMLLECFWGSLTEGRQTYDAAGVFIRLPDRRPTYIWCCGSVSEAARQKADSHLDMTNRADIHLACWSHWPTELSLLAAVLALTVTLTNRALTTGYCSSSHSQTPEHWKWI